ncbi:hypothetical protein AMATHDRAFT_11199 [Amanita thiersii Skay4041]|uniref:Uncharacterized protein n=1 Tax=Amanita thiersii Skay4041 TaxID=703135 RepID=A0A2A9N612_9AGAR|nr:hypothetical protein AMATHDRAFT_11199 [Amanita thiersii Skay4041]
MTKTKNALSKAKEALLKANQKMKESYNKHTKPAREYTIRSKVLLDSSDIKTKQPSKNLLTN